MTSRDTLHSIDIDITREVVELSLYFSSDIQFKERPDLSVCFSIPYECIFVEIINIDHICNGKKCIIGIVYRPPNTDVNTFNAEISEFMSKFNSSNTICYIMGDLNINLLNYESHTPSNEFVDLLLAHSFLPLICKPTRISDSVETLIDNIFSNHVLNTDELVPGLLITDISDHFPIFCLIPRTTQPSSNSEPGLHRPFSAAGQNSFVRLINDTDWSDVLAENNPQSAFTLFHDKLITVYNTAFPVKRISPKRAEKPWITDSLLKCIKRKNQLFAIYKRNKTVFNERRYKSYKYSLQKILRDEKKAHYSSLIIQNRSCMRKTWDVIRGLIGVKQKKISNEFIINNTHVSDPTAISNAFNDYFVNVGPTLASRISPTPVDQTELPPLNPHTMFISDVTPTEVNNVINNLKNSSAGVDCIKPKALKLIAVSVCEPLTHLFNLSFHHGIVPNQLKVARVVPIFKKGNPQSIENYRPISILSSLSKVLERLIYNRVFDFLNNHNIITGSQYGFRKKYSTYMPLIHLLSKIHSALDSGDSVIGLFLDLSKAFDTVDHAILLKKLYRYGLRGVMYDWFKDYLSNRIQCVELDNIYSVTKNIVCGVPQGSILGPLLFLLYINDLPLQSSLSTIMFADDSNLFLQGSNIDDMKNTLNCQLEKIVHWFNVNKLSLNISKTHCMLFTRKRSIVNSPTIVMNNTVINFVHETKFLGVILSSNLRWDKHITNISNKISKNTGILRKLKFKIPKESLLTLYNAFIYPYLYYCNIIWGHSAQCHLAKLLKIQKRAVRLILNKSPREHTAPLFDSLNILTIYQISIYCKCIFMFQLYTRQLPPIFNHLFSFRHNVHNHETRATNYYNFPRCRSEFSRKFLTYSGPFFFNQILNHSDFADILTLSLYKFKNRLHNLIRSNFFSTL